MRTCPRAHRCVDVKLSKSKAINYEIEMPGEALCLLTPCSSLPEPKSARTHARNSAVRQRREGWLDVTRSVLTDASSEVTRARLDAGTTHTDLRGFGGTRCAVPSRHRRRCEVTSGWRDVNNVWSRRVRVQIFRRGKLFVCWSWFGLRQDASVSESQLPSVPGPLLSGNPDHKRHQLGMLRLFWSVFGTIQILVVVKNSNATVQKILCYKLK